MTNNQIAGPGSANAQFKIELPAFNGPLELLLHLIEQQELDITAISLAQVSDQYLAQVERLKESRIDELIDFVVIGAKLLLIKSRALLPQTGSATAEGEFDDPATGLIEQLKLYRQFKRAASWLQQRQLEGRRTYVRLAPPPVTVQRLDLSGVTVESLLLALQAVFDRAPPLAESVAVVKPYSLSLDQQIERLQQLLQPGLSVMFRQLLTGAPDRDEVTVSLLAVLELIKQDTVIVKQNELFGAIELSARPRAGGAGSTNGQAAALTGLPGSQ